MAVTVSTGVAKGRSNDVFGARRVTILQVTLDNSYATNGVAFDPKAFGHQGAVRSVWLQPRFNTTGNKGSAGLVFQYDYANKKILAFRQKDPAAAGGADIPLPEVAAGVDLSGVVFDVIVFSD